mgnify:CR=1 FL=1
MKISRRQFVKAMAAMSAASMLAACGGNSGAASSTAPASSAAAASVEAVGGLSSDPVTLTMSWWGGESRHNAYQDALKAFSAEHSSITVNPTFAAWSGWEEKQSTALAADQGSDVMQVNWNWLFQYSGKGQSFVNLNDYSDVLDLTQFPSSALDACTVANSLQAVPVAMAGRIYYWNMATFKKAGLDHYPTTEQELLDAAKTFQEKLGDDYYPLAAGPLDRMIMMTFYLESKYGEPWVTDSTLNYTVEQLQEGLEWIQSLEDNHVMPDLKTMNAAGDKTITDGQAWITGKYAGIFTWDSSALSASQNLPDDAEYVVGDEIKWGEAANGGFAKVSMGMAITQSCEHPVEAAALINFILNEKEGASIMGTQCGMVCSKAGQEYAKESGAVNELILEANTKVMAFVDQPFDPCYESTSLKDETNGVYGDVFEGFSYDQYDSAEAAQILYDGICEALA